MPAVQDGHGDVGLCRLVSRKPVPPLERKRENNNNEEPKKQIRSSCRQQASVTLNDLTQIIKLKDHCREKWRPLFSTKQGKAAYRCFSPGSMDVHRLPSSAQTTARRYTMADATEDAPQPSIEDRSVLSRVSSSPPPSPSSWSVSPPSKVPRWPALFPPPTLTRPLASTPSSAATAAPVCRLNSAYLFLARQHERKS